jgi:hypothetical protein
MTGRTQQKASGTVLLWHIGCRTASRWTMKARVAARLIANLVPASAADPFIAIAAIILIAVLSTVRIVRRHQHGKRSASAGSAPRYPRPSTTLPAPTGLAQVDA